MKIDSVTAKDLIIQYLKRELRKLKKNSYIDTWDIEEDDAFSFKICLRVTGYPGDIETNMNITIKVNAYDGVFVAYDRHSAFHGDVSDIWNEGKEMYFPTFDWSRIIIHLDQWFGYRN